MLPCEMDTSLGPDEANCARSSTSSTERAIDTADVLGAWGGGARLYALGAAKGTGRGEESVGNFNEESLLLPLLLPLRLRCTCSACGFLADDVATSAARGEEPL